MNAVEVLTIAISYLFGSIPFGLLISKRMRGIDPRKGGSGNVGATNILRVVGRKEAVLTLLLDVLKGILPVLAANLLGLREEVILVVGLATVLGHIFPIFLKFKGGKGVATSFGVFLGLSYQIALMGLAVWALGVYLGGASSVGALAAFGCLPLLSFFLRPDPIFNLFALFISILVYVQHRGNIQRLIKGTE